MSNNNSGKVEEIEQLLDEQFKRIPFVTLGQRWEREFRKELEACISSRVNEARIDENHFHLSNLSHGDARSYSVQKIRDRIRTLKKTGGADEQEQ